MLHERENVQPRSRVWWWVAGVVLALASCQQVDAAANLGDNAGVAVNPAAGLGLPNKKADTAAKAVFLRLSHATRAPFSMMGRGEGQLRLGQCLLADSPTFAMHPSPLIGLRSDGVKPKKEASMPSIALRAFRAVFPVYAIPVSTLPTLSEARALAALLVSRGKRVAIQPAAQGFAVSEVTA